jgi:hypothetical protein
MTDAATLQTQLDTLKAARASGTRLVRFGERETRFRSDAELTNAIAALEAELNPQRPRNVVLRPSPNKGF